MGLLQAKLGYVRGYTTKEKYFLIQVSLSRTFGGVLRKAPFHRMESSNIVCDAFRPLVVSLLTNGTYAAVSPFRQRAAKNLFRGYLFNGYRRLSSQVGYWIVPVVLGAFPRSSPGSRSAQSPLLQATQHTHGPRSTTLTSTARRVTLPTLESTKLHPVNLPIDRPVCHPYVHRLA